MKAILLKCLCIILSLIMILSLSSCSGNDSYRIHDFDDYADRYNDEDEDEDENGIPELYIGLYGTYFVYAYKNGYVKELLNTHLVRVNYNNHMIVAEYNINYAFEHRKI